MFEWFEKLIRDMIWKAIADFVEALPGMAEDKLYEFLRSLKAGEVISPSPLIKIIAVNDLEETITLLLRGPFTFSGLTAFMRVEVIVSRAREDIRITGEDPPIRITHWQTVLGDLTIGSKDKYKGSLGFGFDAQQNSWMGQGSLKLIPLSIGAAIYGGFSDRGLVLGLDGELPKGVSIPLGPTGLGLRGIGGDFAYNFVARLEKEGLPIAEPTAADYVKWARETSSIDRWMAGPIDQTSVGVGIRTVICTKADEGYAIELNPVGFAFLLPGGTFIFGGKGVLLKQKGFGAEGYFVFDAERASLALGVGVNIDLELLKGSGQLDIFFSFSDPTAWYLDLGTESKPVKLEVLQKIPVISLLFSQKAEAYLRINHHRIAFGATLAIGGTFEIGDILKLISKLAVSLHAYMGWDPLLVNARIKVHGEIGIKVWKFEFILSGDAEAEVYFPSPTLFRFEIAGKMNLPWPIPDVPFSKSFGDDIVNPPSISSPLAAGTYIIGGTPTVQKQPVDAIHIISDLQWNLDSDKPWPDLELVVPFSRRVTDRTGKVEASQAVSPSVQGGYTVTDELLELELTDLVHAIPVPDVRAVWADGPGGGMAQLHVLGCDPYAWMTSKLDTSTFPLDSPARTVDTFFGYGPPQLLPVQPRRFASLELTPAAEGDRLLTVFKPDIPARILQTSGFTLRFAANDGESLQVSKIVLFLILARSTRFVTYPSLVSEDGAAAVFQDHGAVFQNLRLVSARFDFPAPVDQFRLRAASGRQPLYIYAIRYLEAAKSSTGILSKKLLMPGRYRLHIKGASNAVHPSGGGGASSPFPPSSPVEWFYDKEFEVAYPETLRPYMYYSTFGDMKIFAKAQHPWTQWTLNTWDPTQFGFGFPLYRGYKTAVRFMVPYVSGIFAETPLKLRITYERGGEITETLTPLPAADGASSLPPESRSWLAAHGGTAAPDQEIVMNSLPGESGPAKLTILFEHPQNGEVRIDEWSGCVSAFMGFKAHLAWPHTGLSTYYDSSGRHSVAECPLPQSGRPVKYGKFDPVRHYRGASGIGNIVLNKRLPANPLLSINELTPIADFPIVTTPLTPFPDELEAPPSQWRLPAPLASQIGPLNETSALRFTRFAAESGALFGLGGAALADINDTVPATTVEAVCDAQGRPYAIWLRTPEPVDWRRVTLTLAIRHVEPAAGCPTGYTHRRALELEISVLPGFDGSSAFLTGSLGGIPTRLPRGDYTLKLTFDPFRAGLPRLYPGDSAGPLPETAVLRFVQPLGLTWPLPSARPPFPWDLPDIPIPVPGPIPGPIPFPEPGPFPIPGPVPFPVVNPGRMAEPLNDASLRQADDLVHNVHTLQNLTVHAIGNIEAGSSGGNTGDTEDSGSDGAPPPVDADRKAFIHLPLPGEFPRVDLTSVIESGGDKP